MNVYDFDGTIYRGDSSVDFYFYMVRERPTILRYIPKQVKGFVLYFCKRITKTQLKEYFFSFLNGIDAKEYVDVFWNKHRGKIHSWYLKQQEPDDIVISASPRFLLTPICKKLGISNLIASEVDIRTGKFEKENCHGSEKAKRLSEEYGVTRMDRFYSDSYSDLPLAEIADHAFIVDKGIVRDWIQQRPRDER